MIPLLFVAAGAYLIGDSIEDKQVFAEGGMINYEFDVYSFGEDEDIDRKTKKSFKVKASNRSKAYEKAKSKYPNHFVELADSYVDDKKAEGGEVSEFDYMMLSRLQSDCEYYLGYGNRSERNLWAGSVKGQIKEMKRIWDSLPEDKKPEWLSMEDILEYERKMTDGGMMAKGGVVKYYNKDNKHSISSPSGSIEKDILDKVKHFTSNAVFVGNFGWKIPQGKLADGYLYELDDYDKNLVKNIKLKEGERVFRYLNRLTAIGGSVPFIKINIDKQLLYWTVENDNDEIEFETRGTPFLWIGLIEN